MENKLISVVIVNYNTAEILRDCLNNLKNVYPNLEIIVVDNASPDDSVKVIKEFKEVVLVANEANMGLAKASNQGLAKTTGDYILYLGADAFPKEGTLAGMLEYMEENTKVGVATSKLVLRDGNLDMDAHRGFPTPWASFCHFSGLNKIFPNSSFFNKYFLAGNNMQEPHEIDLCISHMMLIKREVFFDLKQWDEDFFVYGEDVDFCYRAKQAGWKIMYLPQWETLHYKGSSVGVRKESADLSKATPQIKYEMKRSSVNAMKMFYTKHLTKKYPFFINFLVLNGIGLLGILRTRKK